MSKDDARRHNLAQLHERRKEVVRLHQEGLPVMQIVQLTGLSWPAVRRAIDNYASGGDAAIEPAARGRRSGDGRSMSEAQERSIRELICTHSPAQLGLDGALWNRPLVHALIRRECELDLSERAVGNYIHRWGFSTHVPLSPTSPDLADASRQWLGDVYPALLRKAKSDRAEVHWLEVGELVWADAEEPGNGRRLLAAVTNQRKTRWLVSAGLPDDAGRITFLEALLTETQGPLLLIADPAFAGQAGEAFGAWLVEQSHRVALVSVGDQLPSVAAADDKVQSVASEAVDAARKSIDPPVEKPLSRRRRYQRAEPVESSSIGNSEEMPSTAFDTIPSSVTENSRIVSAQSIESVAAPFWGLSRGKIMRKRSIAAIGLVALAAAAASFIAFKQDKPEKLWAKPMQGDYWAHRVAYPTMHFSPSWYSDAKVADAKVLSDVPAGDKNYRRESQSPLALNPGSWTFLGPQPLANAGYGQVSGRVNVIAVDPSGPDANGNHTVLAASDGGGVWKSTNCCGTGTTWRNTTDQPDIASIAIGDLHIDPTNPNVVYAGTGDLRFGSFSFGSSGVLKSTDKGETWTVLGADVFTPFYPPSASLGFPQYQAVGKVVTDPNNANNVIVGTKTGLFVSNNGGTNWTGPCYTNTHSSQRQDITGLIAQNIGGQTSLLAAIGTRGNPTTVQPDLANLGANGVYRATLPATGCPTTAAWTLLNTGWPAGTGDGNPTGKVLGRIELAVAPTNPNVIYAMGAHATSSNVLGVWRSNDGGANWTQPATSASLPATGCTTTSAGGGSQMWYDAGLTVDPNNAETVLLSGVDLYRSVNGASTFENITCGYGNGNVHVDHHARAYLPIAGGGYDSDKLLSGSDGGVYYTTNARSGTGGGTIANRPTFISLNATIGSIELYSGDITANFATAASPGASAGAQDNGSSWARWSNANPGPTEWTVRNGGDGIYTRIEPVNEQRWYYSSQNGALVVSTAGPNSTPTNAQPTGGWVSPAGSPADTLSFVMPVEIYRYGALDVAGSGCTTLVGCTYMLGGTNRVWETLLGGIPRTSWYVNSPNLTKGTLGNRSFINQLAHAYKSPTVVIVGTNDGNVQVGHGMNQGTANSATWTNVTGGNAVLPNRPVMDVAIDVGDALAPTTSAVGYASLGGFDQNTPATPGHVYQLQCQNSCATFTWRNVSGNLPNIPANSVAVNPHNPNQVFAGTDWGLYYTNDVSAASPVWFRFDNGLPRVMIWDMAIDRGASTLAVFTRGRGVWAWPLPTALGDVIFKNGFDSATP